MNVQSRLVGALLGTVAALGVAGVGFASAQTTPTTAPPAAGTPSTTAAPDTTTPGRSGHCDHDGGTSGRTSAPTGATTSL